MLLRCYLSQFWDLNSSDWPNANVFADTMCVCVFVRASVRVRLRERENERTSGASNTIQFNDSFSCSMTTPRVWLALQVHLHQQRVNWCARMNFEWLGSSWAAILCGAVALLSPSDRTLGGQRGLKKRSCAWCPSQANLRCHLVLYEFR